jgi:acyl-CoA synthetase (AMP-forming)/AMP-acid ligase II
MIRRTLVALSVLAALMLATLPAFAGQFQVGKPVYWVDGVARTMDVAPFIDERGRTMVPVRYLAYALGVPEDGVFWRGKDQVVFLNRGGAGLFLVVGEPVLLVVPGPEAALLARLFRLEDLIAARGEDAARKEVERALEEHPELEELLAVDEEDLEAWLKERAEAIEMDTVPVLKQGRVFLPARFVAQAFGYRVSWEPSGGRTRWWCASGWPGTSRA